MKKLNLNQHFSQMSSAVRHYFHIFFLFISDGEAHVSSDEEDLADDADATDARKRARQADEDYEEGLSDEELDLVKNIAKEYDDDKILDESDFDDSRTPSPTINRK